MQYLVEVHARPLCRSCECVGLSRAAWYAPPLDWTVQDAELIAALSAAMLKVIAWSMSLMVTLSEAVVIGAAAAILPIAGAFQVCN